MLTNCSKIFEAGDNTEHPPLDIDLPLDTIGAGQDIVVYKTILST